MKTLLLTTALLIGGSAAHSQTINDHKINFKYIQLPLIKVDEQFNTYDVKVEHGYLQANEDSTAMFEIRRDATMAVFHDMMAAYQRQCDSLDRQHLRNMATWEKKKNAGTTNPDGTPLTEPVRPIYPSAPTYPTVEGPQLHSQYADEAVANSVNLAGFEQGANGVVITLNLQGIRNIQIIESKKGTGATTKYEYTARYILPVDVKVESPTQGVLYQQTLFTGTQSYKMKGFKSKYEHQLYMIERKDEFFRELEAHARRQTIIGANNQINDQLGYVTRNRTAEIYSVKRFKNYDYSDVTNAFTKTTFALQAIGNDRDRSGALGKIQEAINATNEVLEESNLSDNKARINDKITAMLQCNLAELYLWQAAFNKSEALVNIAMNSGEGKAKRHCKGELGFYKDQRKRWEANF